MSKAHFAVDKVHIDGATEATITVVRDASIPYVEVRGKGKRTVYRLPLREVAEMIAWRAAKKTHT